MKRLTAIALTIALATGIASAQENAAPPVLRLLVQTLSKSDDPGTQLNLLRGMNAALKGKRNLAAPEGWPGLYEKLRLSANEEVRQQAQSLAVIFGGGGAMDELRKALADANANPETRRAALDSLVSAKDAAAVPALLALAKDAGPLRRSALRGLANFDDPQIPAAILGAYSSLSSDEKRDALATLVIRPAWARALLVALDAKTVSRADLSAPLARQLQDLKDPEIAAWLGKNWGAVRETSADKQKQIAGYKQLLTINALEKADPSHGRAIYAQSCAACHTLFGVGGKIGPELPGAFEDVDYLLQNIVDPNAIIGKDYQQTIVQTKDGQVLMGIVAGEDASTLTLKTLAGPLTVQRADVSDVKLMEVSLMPEGLLAALSETDVRNLFAYLRRHGQVPVLLTANNANDFFSGVDLSNWVASKPDAWRVENGEIVGRGNAGRAEFITSDMAADDFRLSAQLRLSGADASAEIAFRGQQTDGGFQGSAIRFGGGGMSLMSYRTPGKAEGALLRNAAALNEWISCEIIAKGRSVRLLLGGQQVLEVNDSPGGTRSVLAFHVSGEGAELRVKDAKLTPTGK